MGLLVACKNEEDPIKNEGARVGTTLFIFWMLKGSLLRSQLWNLADIQTHPSFNSCPYSGFPQIIESKIP